MIDINRLSKNYNVRSLTKEDIDIIYQLCLGNTLFYKCVKQSPNKDEILNDLIITPPNVSINDKYYVGFFDGDNLVSVMDIIDGWPERSIIYIGFFMVDINYQGRGVGSSIISEVISYFKDIKKEKVRLAIDDGNNQSMSFWKKNGFNVIYDATLDGYIKHVAERII